MPPVEIKNNVYWVGAVDWNIRDFHGYSTNQGTSYNAYLAIDEKTTLFDTVKKAFWTDLRHNITQLIDPQKIDYIVVNHVELDHSGSLPEAVEYIKPQKVFCSPMGEKAINDHFPNHKFPLQVVKTGDEISIGEKTVKFYESRMLHWPDSMVSYLEEDKILISNDIFGQHLASSERFDDEISLDELLHHAKKYYANIVMPYGPIVLKFIELVGNEKLEPEILATDHGLIWRKNPGRIIELYKEWSVQKPKRKAVLVYDTMWGSTELMARAIERGLLEEGITVKVMNLSKTHRSDVITEIIDSKAVIFGSPTLNNGYLPSLGDFLTYLKGLRPKDKIGAAFGSYGWGGEAVNLLNQAMSDMKIEVIDPGLKLKYVPKHAELESCVELGLKVGKLIKEKVAI